MRASSLFQQVVVDSKDMQEQPQKMGFDRFIPLRKKRLNDKLGTLCFVARDKTLDTRQKH